MPYSSSNTIRYEYEDSNPSDLISRDPFVEAFDTYFPSGFDLTQFDNHADRNSVAAQDNNDDDLISDPFWENANLVDVLSDFSPADLNLEYITDALLPCIGKENFEELGPNREPSQMHGDQTLQRQMTSNFSNHEPNSTQNEMLDSQNFSENALKMTETRMWNREEYMPQYSHQAINNNNNDSGMMTMMTSDDDLEDPEEQEESENSDEDEEEFLEDKENQLRSRKDCVSGKKVRKRKKLDELAKESKVQFDQDQETSKTLDPKKDTRKDYAKRIEEPQMAGGFVKPSYSYSCLITLALKNSSNGELTVSEIYAFLCEHFPYFHAAPSGWKNSVRHNLSLNKSFQKIEVETPGCHGRKSCLWRLNPNKALKMEQELRKWRDRSEALILAAMRKPCATDLDKIQAGQMGMPPGARRRPSATVSAAVRFASMIAPNVPGAGFDSSTPSGSSSPAHFASIKSSTSSSLGLQFSTHDWIGDQRTSVGSSNRSARRVATISDEFDESLSSSSASSPCPTSLGRAATTRLPLRLSTGTQNTRDTSPSCSVSSGQSECGGGGESLHKAAARKLDFLLQQKSATIFNPSKELFGNPSKEPLGNLNNVKEFFGTPSRNNTIMPATLATNSTTPPNKRGGIMSNSPLSDTKIRRKILPESTVIGANVPIVNQPSSTNTIVKRTSPSILGSSRHDNNSNNYVSGNYNNMDKLQSPLSTKNFCLKFENAVTTKIEHENENRDPYHSKISSSEYDNGDYRMLHSQRNMPKNKNTIVSDENTPPIPQHKTSVSTLNSTATTAASSASGPYQISSATTNFRLNVSPARGSLVKNYLQNHFHLGSNLTNTKNVETNQHVTNPIGTMNLKKHRHDQQEHRERTYNHHQHNYREEIRYVDQNQPYHHFPCHSEKSQLSYQEKELKPDHSYANRLALRSISTNTMVQRAKVTVMDEQSRSPLPFTSTFDTVTDAISNNSLLERL